MTETPPHSADSPFDPSCFLCHEPKPSGMLPNGVWRIIIPRRYWKKVLCATCVRKFLRLNGCKIRLADLLLPPHLDIYVASGPRGATLTFHVGTAATPRVTAHQEQHR